MDTNVLGVMLCCKEVCAPAHVCVCTTKPIRQGAAREPSIRLFWSQLVRVLCLTAGGGSGRRQHIARVTDCFCAGVC